MTREQGLQTDSLGLRFGGVLSGARRDWRYVRRHAVYQREKGRWGEPNPLYDAFRRYSPFVVMLAMVLGACVASLSASTLLDFGLGTLRVALGMGWFVATTAVQILSLIALVLVPALTVPVVGGELRNGTWELLRTIPDSAEIIVQAKLLGALSRLRILWRLLLIATVLRYLLTAVVAFGTYFSGARFTAFDVLLVVLGALPVLIYPWLEVCLAALLGAFVATYRQSNAAALTTTFAILLILRLVAIIPMLAGNTLLGAGLSIRQWIVACVFVAGIIYALRGLRRRAPQLGFDP